MKVQSQIQSHAHGTPTVGVPEGEPAQDFSQRLLQTYMVGVFVAVNALRDAYCLVEGPDCIHMKTQFVQGNHDWFSTLTSVSGFHRIANTALHPVHMARSREDQVQELLIKLARHETTAGVLLTSMPMAFITGADYERICRDVAEMTSKQVIHIPDKSLSGDWLDGYAETLLALAKQLELDTTPKEVKDPKKVAIVGYCYDRNEGDHRANIEHLRALLTGMGAEVVSIWLEGQDFKDIGKIAQAGTVLSFPYARRAARALVKRTGAKLIECELPFGLDASERWLQQVGAALGLEAEAQDVIDAELARVVPALEWVIPFVFQNRRFGYIGDPHLARGFKDIAETLGARLSFAVITDPRTHFGTLEADFADKVPLLVYPTAEGVRKFVQDRVREDKVSLVVANNSGAGLAEAAALVEFGFPSMYTHALFDRPFLGFRGFLAFVDTLANTSRLFEFAQSIQAMGQGGAKGKGDGPGPAPMEKCLSGACGDCA